LDTATGGDGWTTSRIALEKRPRDTIGGPG